MVERIARAWCLAAALVGWGGGPGSAQAPLRLTVEEGVRLALEQNETLEMARMDRRRSQEQVSEARADALPQLGLAMNYNRNWVLPTFIFDTPAGRQSVKIGTDNSLVSSLSLRQTLYAGGRVRAGLRRAREQAAHSTQMERAMRQQVRGEVEERFYEVFLARELVRVSELALQRARANLRQVGALRQAGRVADYDLLRAEVQVASLSSDSTRAQNRLEVGTIALKNTLGLELGLPLEPAGEFREETPLDLGEVEGLLRLGSDQRPELRQLDHLLRASQDRVKVERAGYLPEVDLVTTGQLQFQSNELDLAQDEVWRKSWSSGVAVQMPLFDGQRTGAKVAQARLETRRLETRIEQARREVELEIRQGWMELGEAGARLAAQQGIVGQAEKGLQVAEARYASGAGTQLEILDAQLILLEAQTEHANARRDRALALVRLERAVGALGEQE